MTGPSGRDTRGLAGVACWPWSLTPDDESFGLGAVIDAMVSPGSAVHVLCFTRGHLCVRVDRSRQRRAALLRAGQVSPIAALWRRLQLQGDCEHLRWIEPGGSARATALTIPPDLAGLGLE